MSPGVPEEAAGGTASTARWLARTAVSSTLQTCSPRPGEVVAFSTRACDAACRSLPSSHRVHAPTLGRLENVRCAAGHVPQVDKD